MSHCYRHLSAEDRADIMRMRATHSIRAIAHHLGRVPSSVSRELARHTIEPYRFSRRPVGLSQATFLA
nr:helix-turn-helix domain-containing protein [Halomonas borealis]